ncbi:hypothetical protein BH09PSE6_BH09PSE6_12780 [soil metagenome]
MHYLLIYTTAPDYLERRAQFRDEHLVMAWNAARDEGLLLGGAVGDPPDGAMLLWNVESPDVIERFANADPYVINGLVTQWSIKPWKTVVGADAASPVVP